jgi:hypothetical protein
MASTGNGSATMHDYENTVILAPKRATWNKGKLTGAKPPLWPKSERLEYFNGGHLLQGKWESVAPWATRQRPD